MCRVAVRSGDLLAACHVSRDSDVLALAYGSSCGFGLRRYYGYAVSYHRNNPFDVHKDGGSHDVGATGGGGGDL